MDIPLANAFPSYFLGNAVQIETIPFWLAVFFLSFIYIGFSLTEMSLISLSDYELQKRAESNEPRAIKITRILSEPGRFLATTRAGRVIFGFALTYLILSKLHAFVYSTVAEPVLRWLSFLLGFLIWVLFVLIFCDKLPNRLAQNRPERYSQFSYPFYRFWAVILWPFVSLLTVVTSGVLRICGINPDQNMTVVTEEELRMMLDASRESGNIQAEERTLIENIFEFDDKTVSEVMTHRVDLFSLPLDISFAELLPKVLFEKYTRVPIYDEDIDHIVGVLHTRDLLSLMNEEQPLEFDLATLMRPPVFTPESKNIASLFREMQHGHIHMEIVIDEYGGTAGVVTIEDLLEEIVGQIQDEYDEEEPEMISMGPGHWLINGAASPEDVALRTGMPLPPDDYETMAGMVLDLLDRIPDEDEQPVVVWQNTELKVRRMEDKRIELIDLYARSDALGQDSDARGAESPQTGKN